MMFQARDFSETMHVRFGTPGTTALNVIFAPPLNIVSFAKSRWFFATLEQFPPGHAHPFGAPASRRDACGDFLLTSAIQPTGLQAELAACVRSRPLAPRASTATPPTSNALSTSRSANVRLTLPASAAGRLDSWQPLPQGERRPLGC